MATLQSCPFSFDRRDQITVSSFLPTL